MTSVGLPQASASAAEYGGAKVAAQFASSIVKLKRSQFTPATHLLLMCFGR
jgi:hypothetical protein